MTSLSTTSQVGDTGVGWDKFWLGQCPSVPNESPDGDINEVFGEYVTTAFTGATRIIDVRFASVISQKNIFDYKSRSLSSCFDLGWKASDKAHYVKGLHKGDAICMA